MDADCTRRDEAAGWAGIRGGAGRGGRARYAVHAMMAIVLVMACAAGVGCAGGGAPSARLVDARLADLTADGVTLQVDVEVRNPGREPLRLEGLSYAMTATEDEFATGPFLEGEAAAEAMSVREVGARSTARVTTPVTIAFTDVLDALDSGEAGTVVPWRAELAMAASRAVAIEDGAKGPDASASGSREDLSLAFDAEGRLPILKMPEVEVGALEWTDVGLLSARGRSRVTVTNTNRFVLEVRRVSYEIEVQGASIAAGGITRSRRLGAGETVEIDVPVRVSAAKIAAAVLDASRRGNATFRMRGMLDFAADGIPLKIPLDHRGGTRMLAPTEGGAGSGR
jgi:LEA14-like dessication related protein